MDLDAGTRPILDLDVLLEPFWSADRRAAWMRGGFKGRGSKKKLFFASIFRIMKKGISELRTNE